MLFAATKLGQASSLKKFRSGAVAFTLKNEEVIMHCFIFFLDRFLNFSWYIAISKVDTDLLFKKMDTDNLFFFC